MHAQLFILSKNATLNLKRLGNSSVAVQFKARKALWKLVGLYLPIFTNSVVSNEPNVIT